MNRLLKEVTIEILQKCNSNCIFCSSKSNSFSNNEISFDKLINIIKFCKEKGASSINISGGEPLLHKNIVDIIKFCNDLELKSIIYTSGNIKLAFWNQFIKKIEKLKNFKFIVNYPSCENEIYQRLTGNKQYCINDLNKLLINLITKNIDVEAHIVPNNINIASLFKTAAYLKSISIKRVSFLRLVMQGRAYINSSELEISQKKIQNEIFRIKQELSNSHFKIREGVPFSTLSKNKCKCFAGINKLTFRYDGLVFPCEAFKEAPNNNYYVLGSIYNDDLNSIWENYSVLKKLIVLRKQSLQYNEPCPAQLLFEN